MTDERKGGIALIAGTIALFLTMAAHPTGHELLQSGSRFNFVALVVLLVHALAELAIPVLFLGALALSKRLNTTAAMVIYGFSLVAGMLAAAFSGFVAPALARQLADATAANKDTLRLLFSFNGALNQAFARIFTIASSIALILWSAEMWKSRTFPRFLAGYGIAAATAILIAVAPGFLSLNVHGFGLVVLLQGAWFIATGTEMMRVRELSA